MTILEKIKFEEDWLSEVNLTKENIKIAFAGIRATVLEQQPRDNNWKFYYDHGYAQAKRDLLCEDCVSRKAVMFEIDESYNIVDLEKRIKDLPSVQPTRPKGKWIPYYDRWGDVITNVSHFKCSVCGEYDYDKDKFCPNCGADMRGEAE